jgi:hypothetical protein
MRHDTEADFRVTAMQQNIIKHQHWRALPGTMPPHAAPMLVFHNLRPLAGAPRLTDSRKYSCLGFHGCTADSIREIRGRFTSPR